MSYRNDVEALHARIEALERELAEITRERDSLLVELAERAGRGAGRRAPPPHVQDPPRPTTVKLDRDAKAELAEAKREKEQLLLADPDVPAMANVAERLFRLGDWDGAKALYERMLDMYLGPSGRITRSEVYLNLGRIFVKLDRRGEALTMYQRGLRHDPLHPDLLQAVAELGR